MPIQFIGVMENSFEIGQKVKWQIGQFLCRGVFIEKNNDNETSLVQLHTKDGKRHICKINVISTLLERD